MFFITHYYIFLSQAKVCYHRATNVSCHRQQVSLVDVSFALALYMDNQLMYYTYNIG